jgi:hypothetical protein
MGKTRFRFRIKNAAASECFFFIFFFSSLTSDLGNVLRARRKMQIQAAKLLIYALRVKVLGSAFPSEALDSRAKNVVRLAFCFDFKLLGDCAINRCDMLT